MIVLGVDPGTAATGYGVLSGDGVARPTLLECGIVRTRRGDDLAARLERIYDGIAEVIARHHPDCMSIESVFYAKNVRTTLVLGHARGAVLLAARKSSIPIFEYSPAEIKKSVAGAGSATKEQVQYMLAHLLGLRSAPQPSDAADGVAAALAHLNGARFAELAQLPASGVSGAAGGAGEPQRR